MNLTIDAVSKSYRGGVRALDDVSLEVSTGVLGLLGPNGAGKSTLMRVLATLARPSRGRVLWNGHELVREPNRLRAVLGYLPQDFAVYPRLTAVEFLEYIAAAKGLAGAVARRRIDELLEVVNLSTHRDRALGGFSGGMRQRVGIAQALLNDPELLIVDEPSAGLDPEERVRLRDLFAELGEDRIVILSTHIVSDVEAVAGSLALIRGGRLIAHASPDDLLRGAAGAVWDWTIAGDELPAVRKRFRISATSRREGAVRVRIVSRQSPGPGAEAVAPTLEDAYLLHVAGDGAAA